MLLIIIHELGHFLTGAILGINIDKICLYPYGGITKFKMMINTKRLNQWQVLIMGPIFQIIFYYIFSSYINNIYLSKIFLDYHLFLLFFNLMPIYPLDGGRILFLILSYFKPYKKSFYYTVYFSYLVIILLISYFLTSSNIIISIVLISLLYKLKKEKKLFPYIFERFILERVLYNLKFKNIKIVKTKDEMMLDTLHYFKISKTIIPEKNYLTR